MLLLAACSPDADRGVHAHPGLPRVGHQPGSTPQGTGLARGQPQLCAPVPASQSIEEALDKLDAELEGHMQAEETRKRAMRPRP